MNTYGWKVPIFKASAQTVAEELNSLGEKHTLKQVVEYAENPKTELHKCFEWNDTVAAGKYRLHQAGQVERNLIIVTVDKQEGEKQTVRLFHPTNEKATEYAPIQYFVQNKNAYDKLLEQAKKELAEFEQRYKSIVELKNIFNAFHEFLGSAG